MAEIALWNSSLPCRIGHRPLLQTDLPEQLDGPSLLQFEDEVVLRIRQRPDAFPGRRTRFGSRKHLQTVFEPLAERYVPRTETLVRKMRVHDRPEALVFDLPYRIVIGDLRVFRIRQAFRQILEHV